MTIETADYAAARDAIRDGDVVILRAGWFHSPLSFCTRALLRTPYTHTSVALWLEAGLWCTETNLGGNRMVPLSQYQDTAWDVFPCPLENRQKVRHTFLTSLRHKTNYDIADLLVIVGYRLMGWQAPAHDDGDLVCSSYSIQGLIDAGWEPDLPILAAPDQLAAALSPPILRYRPAA